MTDGFERGARLFVCGLTSWGIVVSFFHLEKPGPLGQVRGDWLCLL
jgi:hypothetical protein